MKNEYILKNGDCFYGTPPSIIKIISLKGILISIFIKNKNRFGIIYLDENMSCSLIIQKIKIIIKKIKNENIPQNKVLIRLICLDIPLYREVFDYVHKLGVENNIKHLSKNNFYVIINTSRKKIYIKKSLDMIQENRDIKILIVDDSLTMRKVLKDMLKGSQRISQIFEASNAKEAEQIIKFTPPDVISLDINMPEMDGVTFLKTYMKTHPIPTIMVTSFNINDSGHLLEALESGAFDYMEKPSFKEIKSYQTEFLEKIYQAFEARGKVGKDLSINTIGTKQLFNKREIHKYILAIGSSTGGIEALRNLLTGLPANIPATLIVQHIPPLFSQTFAERMNELCPFLVKQAEDGDLLGPNKVIVAQGGKHMKLLVNDKGNLYIRLTDDPAVNRFKPSIDYLFNSIHKVKPKKNLIAVLLTGMGWDGAKELLNLKNIGAYTIVQDEESSVVFGMPKTAIDLGAHCKVEKLERISNLIVKKMSEGVGKLKNSKYKRS